MMLTYHLKYAKLTTLEAKYISENMKKDRGEFYAVMEAFTLLSGLYLLGSVFSWRIAGIVFLFIWSMKYYIARKVDEINARII